MNFDHRRAARQMAEVAGAAEERVWDIVFGSDLEMEYERGAISTYAFYEAFCSRTQTCPNYEALLLAGADIFDLNQSVVPLINELRDRGHRLGVLSNTNEAHWNFIAGGRFPIVNDSFEQYALSYKMRAVKPDLAAYQIASQIAGVAPHEIFFTDDRLDNVVAAQNAGFDACQFVDVETLRELLILRGMLS